LKWLRTPHVPDYAEPNFQSYAIQLTDEAPFTQMELMGLLLERGISTRRGIMLAHREPADAGQGGGARLPCSEWASDHSLLLPLFPQMADADVDRVADTLAALGKTARRAA
jgi:dTDP-4-amino-4,6-dideoxygalactose transaminase